MHNEMLENFRARAWRPDEIVKLSFTSFRARSGVITASIRDRSYFSNRDATSALFSLFFFQAPSFFHFPRKLNSIIIRRPREESSRISFSCAKNGSVGWDTKTDNRTREKFLIREVI